MSSSRSREQALYDRHEGLTATARERHDALTAAIETLEHALAEAAFQRERSWAQGAARRLAQVQVRIRSHIEGIEEADGLFEEIAKLQPHLASRVSALCRDHRSLEQRATQLASAFASEAEPDVGSLRREAALLLSDLRAHRATEADLIYEAFWTEIGGGD